MGAPYLNRALTAIRFLATKSWKLLFVTIFNRRRTSELHKCSKVWCEEPNRTSLLIPPGVIRFHWWLLIFGRYSTLVSLKNEAMYFSLDRRGLVRWDEECIVYCLVPSLDRLAEFRGWPTRPTNETCTIRSLAGDGVRWEVTEVIIESSVCHGARKG